MEKCRAPVSARGVIKPSVTVGFTTYNHWKSGEMVEGLSLVIKML